MGILSAFKNFVYKADIFYTPQLLRVKEQPQYQTLFGGIVSLAIIIGLLATFYNKVIQTLDMIIINSSMQDTNSQDPVNLLLSTFKNGFFMFGVQIWHHNLNQGKRYFDVVLTNTHYSTGIPTNQSIQIELQPCTKDHWRDYPRAMDNFDRLHMDYWKCLPKDKQFLIHGKYASAFSRTLDVAIKKCTNLSLSDTRPCASDVQIDDFFNENGNFYYTIYFLNPLINPQSQNYITYYLQDSNYIIFDKNGGQQAQLWIQDYKIVTDESILPFSNIRQQKGGIVTKNAIKNRYNYVDDIYATFFFFKSPNSMLINRTFQKIDQILSYIGGLFGTIAIMLFLVSTYNGYSFQISMAGYLYKRDNQDQNIFKKYNFLYFLGHLTYVFLKIFNVKPKWKRIKRYYQCRQQMLKQFDILFLYKRIIFLQKTIKYMMEQHQLKGLHLSNQLTLDQAKQYRKSYKLKSKLFSQIRQYYKSKQSNSNSIISNNNNKISNINIQNQINQIKINDYNNTNCNNHNFNNSNNKNINNNVNKNNQRLFNHIYFNQSQSVRKQSSSSLNSQSTHLLIQQDIYSSQQQSDEQTQQQLKKQLFLIDIIRKLKKDKLTNKLSDNIWNNIQPKLIEIIQPILDNVIQFNQINNNRIKLLHADNVQIDQIDSNKSNDYIADDYMRKDKYINTISLEINAENKKRKKRKFRYKTDQPQQFN